MAKNARPRPKVKPALIKRATPDTKFYIDFDWWEQSNLDLKAYLRTRLNISDDAVLDTDIDLVDLVDSQTGMVRRVDGYQYLVQAYFRQLPDDFIAHASLVDAAFSVLLSNANEPTSAREIAQRVGRSPDVVVKTLGGPKIYQGIRPQFDD